MDSTVTNIGSSDMTQNDQNVTEDEEFEEEDEDTLLPSEDSSLDQSLAEVYKTVVLNEDVILIIDLEAEEVLRRGLIALKYKQNKAAKEVGGNFDNRSLEFKVLPWTEVEKQEVEDWQSKLKIQVWLKAKSSIRVHRVIITDKEF